MQGRVFFLLKGKEWVRKIRKETGGKKREVKQRLTMHSTCSYLRLVVLNVWNLRTKTEAGSERGRRQEVGGGGGREGGEKEAVCTFTHCCRSRAPCKNSSGSVGHLECGVTSSVCDRAATGAVRSLRSPSLQPPTTQNQWGLQGYWQRSRKAGPREVTTSNQMRSAWNLRPRRRRDNSSHQLDFSEGVPFPL